MSLGFGTNVRTGHRARLKVEPFVDLVQSGHAVVKHGLAPWQSQYRRRAVVLDLLLAGLASAGSLVLRLTIFGGPNETWAASGASTKATAVVVPLAWVFCLSRCGAYAARFLGTGNEEYRAVLRSLVVLLASLSVFSYAFKLEVSRAFALFVLPAVVILTMLSRWALRNALMRTRKQGENLQSTVVVGPVHAVADMVRQIQREPASTGLRVVGACVSEVDDTWMSLGTIEGVPIVGGLDDTLQAVDELHADLVAVASNPDLSGDSLRRLGWSLEYRGVDLLVAPGIVGVAGPRLHLRPANGLPMLHVERPLASGVTYSMKSVADRVFAGAIVLVFSPILLLLAAMIRWDSKGPALFKQQRVGNGGAPFTMYKFRSMCVDAEARLAALAQRSDGNDVLFKMREDPRITRVGRVLRKYSLDELPQLLNVMLGHMSLVGPRPPLRSEVDAYEFDALRRLRVRPGMTGLWQVSGRSDLSWEDSLRLDLWYVDNWSPSLDLQIVTRTFRAVFNGSGAY